MAIPCQGCNGPIEIHAPEDKIIITQTMTISVEDGSVVSETEAAGWCADCIRSWNQALQTDL